MAEQERAGTNPVMRREWTDVHDDKLEAFIELAPVPWFAADGESMTYQPVIYITGDAYLSIEQAVQVASHLEALAANLRVKSAMTGKRKP